MAVPAALMGTGTAVQIIGQYGANYAKAQQELKNAAFYEQQAASIRQSAIDQEGKTNYEWSNKIGAQVGAYAKGGVDLSGSAALTVGSSVRNALSDAWNIKQNADMQVKIAQTRAAQSEEMGKMLESPMYNLIQASGTGIADYASTEGFGKGFPSWMKPDTLLPSNDSGNFKFFPSANTQSTLGTKSLTTLYYGNFGG